MGPNAARHAYAPRQIGKGKAPTAQQKVGRGIGGFQSDSLIEVLLRLKSNKENEEKSKKKGMARKGKEEHTKADRGNTHSHDIGILKLGLGARKVARVAEQNSLPLQRSAGQAVRAGSG